MRASEKGATPLSSLSQSGLQRDFRAGERASDPCGGNGWSRPRERVSGTCAGSMAVSSTTAVFNAIQPLRPMLVAGPAPGLGERATPWRKEAAGRKAGAKRHALDGVAHAEAPSSKSGPQSLAKSNTTPCPERSFASQWSRMGSRLLAPKTPAPPK